MPTYNRRQFVGQAIYYFLRQDYPRKELVVLDDGEDAVADQIPPDERIRYVRLDGRLPLGAKRNLGCELSHGEYIAHWDDDDWIASHRLRTQIDRLLETEADVCGTTELLHYELASGAAWLYRHTPEGRPWLAGGTLLYRRQAWARSPFPQIDAGEDTEFIHRQPAERVSAIADSSFYIALIHRGNTTARRLTDPHWQRCSTDDIRPLLAQDGGFYTDLRNSPQPLQHRSMH